MEKYLLREAGFAFAAAVQPGPFQAYLINETLARGWRRTMPAVFGPIISDAPIIVITLLLLSRVPGNLVPFLHLFGGIFLFYLAWGAFRSWRQVEKTHLDNAASGPQTLFKSALVNFLNPNPWLGWSLVMGPLFLEGVGLSVLALALFGCYQLWLGISSS